MRNEKREMINEDKIIKKEKRKKGFFTDLSN